MRLPESSYFSHILLFSTRNEAPRSNFQTVSQTLIDELMPLSEKMLGEYREFLPYGSHPIDELHQRHVTHAGKHARKLRYRLRDGGGGPGPFS